MVPKLEAAVSGGGVVDTAAGLDLLRSVFPQQIQQLQDARGNEKLQNQLRNDKSVAGARVSIGNAARAACQRLTQRAVKGGVPPMSWVPPGAAGPVLPAFLDWMFELSSAGFTDQQGVAVVCSMLEDVADSVGGDDCGGVLAWLQQREDTLSEVRDLKTPILRLCNRLLSRLSRASDPQLCASILLFMTKVFPLSERSGMNLMNSLSPALISRPEEVSPGTVDSNGQPIDTLMYNTTWALQPLLHSPKDVVVPDTWAKFVSDVRVVLGALATQPAQVAAGAAGSATMAAPDSTQLDGGVNGVGGGDGGGGGGEGTVGYLSSPQLFGLQLRDATFRRDLLVQVLILLHAVQNPVKQEPPLRTKQLQEAQALEGAVITALEATPEAGKAFAAAVLSCLRREDAWVLWKKGGAPPFPQVFNKEGKLQPCPDYDRKPLEPSLREQTRQKEEAAAAAEARIKARRDAMLSALAREKRSALEMDIDEMMAPRKRIKTDSDILKGVSRLDTWVYHVPDSNMDGLKASERPGFPTLDLLARPTLDQMDPESCVEPDYRLARTDPVYRWRMARLMARHWPGSQSVSPLPPWMPVALKDRLTSAAPDEIEFVLGRIMTDKIPEAWVEAAMAAKNATQEAVKDANADAAGNAGEPPTAAPTPTGTVDGIAGAAAAGAAAGGDEATGAEAAAGGAAGAAAGAGAAGAAGDAPEAEEGAAADKAGAESDGGGDADGEDEAGDDDDGDDDEEEEGAVPNDEQAGEQEAAEEGEAAGDEGEDGMVE